MTRVQCIKCRRKDVIGGTVLSLVYSLFIVFGKAFTILSIDHTLGLGIVNTI